MSDVPEREPGPGADAGAGGEAGPQPSGVDLARVALAAAKERARARGAVSRQRRQARTGGLRSGARPGGRDPVALGSVLGRLPTERGWERRLAVHGVLERWPELVGAANAGHWRPERFDEDARELVVRCDSTAWATELRFQLRAVLARLNERLGQGAVASIRVLGPAGGPRSAGPLRAPGSRGPGDTYG